jgi:hypothetical protein
LNDEVLLDAEESRFVRDLGVELVLQRKGKTVELGHEIFVSLGALELLQLIKQHAFKHDANERFMVFAELFEEFLFVESHLIDVFVFLLHVDRVLELKEVGLLERLNQTSNA